MNKNKTTSTELQYRTLIAIERASRTLELGYNESLFNSTLTVILQTLILASVSLDRVDPATSGLICESYTCFDLSDI